MPSGLANGLCSDTSASPEKQAEQIKAICPIVDGQQATAAHSHTNLSAPDKSAAGDNPEEAKGDIIDIGSSDGAATPSATNPPAKKPDEIESLLTSTGKPADGPLIDFAQDMKKDLPAGQDQPKDSHG